MIAPHSAAKLRGAFDPRVQMALGGVVLACSALAAVQAARFARLTPQEKLDLQMLVICPQIPRT